MFENVVQSVKLFKQVICNMQCSGYNNVTIMSTETEPKQSKNE